MNKMQRLGVWVVILVPILGWATAWFPVWRTYERQQQFTFSSDEAAACGVDSITATSLLKRYKGILPLRAIYDQFEFGAPTGVFVVNIGFVGGEQRILRFRNQPHNGAFRVVTQMGMERNILVFKNGDVELLSVTCPPGESMKWFLITND